MAQTKLTRRLSALKYVTGHRNSVNFYSHQKAKDISELSMLRYKSGDTLQIHNRQKAIYKQTDVDFIKDIRKIVNLKKNKLMQLLSSGQPQLSKQKCNQLDFRARIHSKANIINENTKKQYDQIQILDQCKCGCRRGKGKLIPLMTNLQKLSILGPGVLLQFLFKKSSVIFLLMAVLVYSIYGITTNLMGSQAYIDDNCNNNMYCKFKSLASDQNKLANTNVQNIQSWLGVVFCILWVLALRLLKHVGKQKNKIIDKKLSSSSDFTIKISNLPRGSYQQTELINYLSDLWKQKLISQQKQSALNNIKNQIVDYSNKQLNCKAIQIIYNMEFSRKIIQQILTLIIKLDEYLEFQDPNNQKGLKNFIKKAKYYRNTKQQLIYYFQILQDLRKRFLNDKSFRKSISATSCLIQFKSQKDKKQILKYFGAEKVGMFHKILLMIKNLFNPKKQVLFKGKILKIERAPEPSDIIWENCQKSESMMRKLAIIGITFLVILVSFTIIIGLQLLQKYIQKNPQSFKAGLITTIINIATSLAMQIINSILWTLMTYLLNLQYNHTETQKIVSQMNKVFVLTSINIIVLPILSNYLIQGSGFMYGNQGLAGLAFDYHISAIITVIKGLFNTVAIIKSTAICIKFIRIKIIRYLCTKQKLNLLKGDPNVNKFYQGQQFNIAQNYIFIIVTILQAVFFCKLQPIILLIATFSILLFFIVNKIKLLRLCKIPSITQYLVFDTACFLLGYAPIYYGVGYIVLSYFQNKENSDYQFQILQPIICIGIGVLGLTNPKDVMNKIIRAFLHCFCINPTTILGIDQDQQIQSQAESEQESAISIKSQKEQQKYKKSKQHQSNRIQSYYENSNMLSLFGFQFILKDQQNQDVCEELKNYCQSFFPKIQVQPLVHILTQKIIGQNNTPNHQ